MKYICIKECSFNTTYYLEGDVLNTDNDFNCLLYKAFPVHINSLGNKLGEFIRENFIPLADWREMRINEILDL